MAAIKYSAWDRDFIVGVDEKYGLPWCKFGDAGPNMDWMSGFNYATTRPTHLVVFRFSQCPPPREPQEGPDDRFSALDTQLGDWIPAR